MRKLRLIWLKVVRGWRSDRFFQIKPPFKGPGWYFDVRGGEAWGPYATLEDAKRVAERFAVTCRTDHDTGGRSDLIPSAVVLS